VNAPIEKVWDFIIDPQKMGPCIPGFVSAEKIDETTYKGVAKVKVGIIKLKMYATTRFTEVDPPRRLRTEGDGHDKLKAGKFHQESTIDLTAKGESETEVHYCASIRVVGKLATFGEKIMRMTAGKMGEQIAANIRDAIGRT
jgi:carbon monoxide dehydrogenase subunit G